MIVFDRDLCVGCGECIKDCVSYCITMEDGKACLKADSTQCIQCGHCIAVCPVNAVGIEDAEYETAAVEEIGEALPKVDTAALVKSLKFRRSVRQYEKRPIPKEALENIIAAAHWTATGSNHQKFRMVVVQERMEEFRRMAWEEFRAFIRALPEDSPYHGYGIIQRAQLPEEDPMQDTLFWGAPCLIVTASENNVIWDAGMSSESMELAALSQDLGALFSGYLVGVINRSEELKAWLGISGCTVKTCVLMGYPAVHYKRSAPRKFTKVSWL